MPDQIQQPPVPANAADDENLWPAFEELITPPAQPKPEEILKKQAESFNHNAQGVLRAEIFTEPPRRNTGVPVWRHFFYITSTQPQDKVELFHAEHGSDEELVSQRYPVTLYYPHKPPYHGATLYDRGIVLLDDGNYADDTLTDALRRIFQSKYTKEVIGKLYRKTNEFRQANGG